MARFDDVMNNICDCNIKKWGCFEIIMIFFCCSTAIPIFLIFLLIIFCLLPQISLLLLTCLNKDTKIFDIFNLYNLFFGATLRADPHNYVFFININIGSY
jgi:hypothetical protein